MSSTKFRRLHELVSEVAISNVPSLIPTWTCEIEAVLHALLESLEFLVVLRLRAEDGVDEGLLVLNVHVDRLNNLRPTCLPARPRRSPAPPGADLEPKWLEPKWLEPKCLRSKALRCKIANAERTKTPPISMHNAARRPKLTQDATKRQQIVAERSFSRE